MALPVNGLREVRKRASLFLFAHSRVIDYFSFGRGKKGEKKFYIEASIDFFFFFFFFLLGLRRRAIYVGKNAGGTSFC